MNILFNIEGIYFLCYIIREEVSFMKKNYYEILQIDKNASLEIVEKSYKTLVKMYHPDLQKNIDKQEYEEKLKLINEAYEVLSDEEKRKEYDLQLEQEEINNVKKSNITKDCSNQKHPPRKIRYTLKYNSQLNKTINQAYRDAYNDAYIKFLKDKGYKIIYKKSLKDYFTNFISIIITIFILLLLWQIPFIRNFFSDNIFIRTIVDVFKNLFQYI